jgi:hypothetical protein
MHKATTIQKNFRKLFDLKLIGILVIVVFFMTGTAYAQLEEAPSQDLILSTHTNTHLVGEHVSISGKYSDTTDKFIVKTVDIKIYNSTGHRVDDFKVTTTDGRFLDKSFSTNVPDRYKITAESETGTAYSTLFFTVVNFHETFAFLAIMVCVISFVLLMGIMAFIGRNIITIPIYHVSRFSLISIIVFSMLSFFIVSNFEIGTNSAIGIIFSDQIPPEDKDNANALGLIAPLKLDWVLKFGGNISNTEPAGLEIPLYILIFGVLGGYLRFFYFTSNPWLKREILKRLDKSKERYFIQNGGDGLPVSGNENKEGEGLHIDPVNKEGKRLHIDTDNKNEKYKIIINEAYTVGHFYPVLSVVLTNRLMSDLSLLLIAPVLAVMLFFVLSQSGLNLVENVLTFAVTSFTAGLFTEDVIKKLKTGSKKDDDE